VVIKLLAFVLPLGLDSFAVAAAIGATQVSGAWQRTRVSLIFVVFEGGMPLIGLGLGSALARGIGSVADYLAASSVIAVGAWMLLARGAEDSKANQVTTRSGLALIALGISISLDELAIGFSIGHTSPRRRRHPRDCHPGARRRATWPGHRHQDRRTLARTRRADRRGRAHSARYLLDHLAADPLTPGISAGIGCPP
jgi:Putative manganese efflux pump